MKSEHIHKTGILVGMVLILMLGILIPFSSLNKRGPSETEITGDVVAGVYVFERYPKSCLIDLLQGWNLISFYCKPQNKAADSVFNITSIISVHAYDAFDDQDPWKIYNPSLPSWVIQDLSLVHEKMGFWLRSNESTQLNVSGNLFIPSLVDLDDEWNLVGYPINKTKYVNVSVQNSLNNLTMVWTYDAATGKSYVYLPSNSSGTNLTYMVPLFGYWFNMTNESLWFVDW